MKRCGDCKFGDTSNGGLQCRRYPPQLLVQPPHPNYPNVMQVEERWPWVDPQNHWCGEYKQQGV